MRSRSRPGRPGQFDDRPSVSQWRCPSAWQSAAGHVPTEYRFSRFAARKMMRMPSGKQILNSICEFHPNWTGNKEHESDLNLNVFVGGAGFDLDKINAKAQIKLSPSQVKNIAIDTLGTSIDFIRKNLIINSFLLKVLSAQLQLNGNYSLQGNSDLFVNLKLDSIQEIAAFTGIEELETSLDLNAHVLGQLENLQGDVNLNIGKTRYQDLSLDSVFAVVNAHLTGKEVKAQGNLQANRLQRQDLILDSIQLHAETDLKSADINLNVESKEIQAKLKSMIRLGEIINVALSDLWLNYKGYAWKLSEDTAHVSIGKKEYEIENFHLVSSQTDTVQSISVNGKISRTSDLFGK